MSFRPRRSALYMPGSNQRALAKARELPADVLILDLEDAVAPAAKESARVQIAAALAEGGYGARELLVRVNGLDTPWGADDLRAFAGAGADGIVLPKVSSADDVLQAVRLLDVAGAGAGMRLWCMAETARGILAIDAIAGAHPCVAGILMGTSDLARELRVSHAPQRLGFLTALGQCVLAARAHGLDILDGVHLDLHDDAGLQAVCAQGRELGFDGKTLIHPAQLAAANAAFAPTTDEVAAAHEIIAAWREAQSHGGALVVVKGRLVENLHVAEAERLLAVAEAVERMGW
jgi:citrate lyase subunit beta/citryl-CoA lyase